MFDRLCAGRAAARLVRAMNIETHTLLQNIAAGLFCLALIHTISTKKFERLAAGSPRHACFTCNYIELLFGESTDRPY